jgi:hypothetical protein
VLVVLQLLVLVVLSTLRPCAADCRRQQRACIITRLAVQLLQAVLLQGLQLLRVAVVVAATQQGGLLRWRPLDAGGAQAQRAAQVQLAAAAGVAAHT